MDTIESKDGLTLTRPRLEVAELSALYVCFLRGGPIVRRNPARPGTISAPACAILYICSRAESVAC